MMAGVGGLKSRRQASACNKVELLACATERPAFHRLAYVPGQGCPDEVD